MHAGQRPVKLGKVRRVFLFKNLDWEVQSMGRNSDLKTYAFERGIRLWQVAEKLGITDSTFSKRLRRNLSVEEKTNIKAIIDELSQNGSE